jgi:hypothetical protein
MEGKRGRERKGERENVPLKCSFSKISDHST